MMPRSSTAQFILRSHDRERLEYLIQSGDYSRQFTNRFNIVLQSGNGLKASEIAKGLGIALSAVYRWRSNYLRYGMRTLLRPRRLK